MLSRRQFLATLAAGASVADLRGRTGPTRTSKIQVGVCASPADLESAEQLGFDYFEPPAAAVAAMTEAEFQAFRTRARASRIRCSSFNSFVRTLKVVGESVSRTDLQRYLDLCLDRCRELGAEIIVWGSSGSRNVPEGFSRERAWEQIKEFLRMAGDRARQRRLVIAVEPLRHQESNIINTGGEALRLVREVNHPNVRMIIDYYHLRVENEDPEIILRARRQIVHFHFANPRGRRWPRDPSEDSGYAPFFAALKQINFGGGISIEGNGSLQQDGRASLEFFRQELA